MTREEANKIVNEDCSKLEAAIVKHDEGALIEIFKGLNIAAGIFCDPEIFQSYKEFSKRASELIINNMAEVA